ncbi:MAG TPA: protein kinase, partial [Tepidisphaeraceae bacterium]|nr:protein kinase [Tepidisphaeraceae bacterium]
MSLFSSSPQQPSLATCNSPQEGTMPQSLFGYELIDTVGEGAGSVIYVVSHPQTRQLYALKHVIRKTEKHARFIEQLENEFEVGRKCSHPNLRRVIDYQTKKTLLGKVTEAALVMELFDGEPLEFNLPRTTAGLVEVFIKTAEALDALHRLGYIHCDLKPNNILVSADGQ